LAAIVTGIYLNIPMEAVVETLADGLMNFSLLAIPSFIIMGEIMNEGDISQKIVNLANLCCS
jgi:TRAP-type mannitol/chloroaromatic compound transport system permease large subunit